MPKAASSAGGNLDIRFLDQRGLVGKAREEGAEQENDRRHRHRPDDDRPDAQAKLVEEDGCAHDRLPIRSSA